MTKKVKSKATTNNAKSIDIKEYARVLADVKKRVKEAQGELLPPKEEGASWELLSNLRILTKLSLPFQQF